MDPEYLQFGTGSFNKIDYRHISTVEELQERLTVAQKELLNMDDKSVNARILDYLLEEVLTKKPSRLRVTIQLQKKLKE